MRRQLSLRVAVTRRMLLSALSRAENSLPERTVYTQFTNLRDFHISYGRVNAFSTRVVPTCWQCRAVVCPLDPRFCQECKAVQPMNAPPNDSFAILGFTPPYTYDIDIGQLESTYKQLQKTLHPDKFSSASAEEQGHSAQHSAHINRAYELLKHPVHRALELLSHSGQHVVEESIHTLEDQELLLFVMEAREEVDSASDPDTLRSMLKEVSEKSKGTEMELSKLFNEKDWMGAVRETIRLRYLHRIQEAILDKL